MFSHVSGQIHILHSILWIDERIANGSDAHQSGFCVYVLQFQDNKLNKLTYN